MIEQVVNFDHWLFGRINQDFANSFFDWFFPVFTELLKLPLIVYVAIPALLIIFVLKLRYRFFPLLLSLGLALAITDSSSHHLIKKTVHRARPPQTEGLSVTLRTFPHAGPSFPSNHAANCFAAAVVLTSFFYGWRWAFYIFAALVGFSRVYVGVHFPLDVVAGALWGGVIAYIVVMAMKPFDQWTIRKFPSAKNFPNLN